MNDQVTYRHTPDMGEISGFGGTYEDHCQKMLEAGVRHIEKFKLSGNGVQLSGLQGVYGLCFPENRPAKELEDAIVAAVNGDLTGAMHQAVMTRLMYVAKLGWEGYCEECRKAIAEKAGKH